MWPCSEMREKSKCLEGSTIRVDVFLKIKICYNFGSLTVLCSELKTNKQIFKVYFFNLKAQKFIDFFS